MPMARTRRGRLRQLEHWLSDQFPTPRSTYVRVCDLKRSKGGPFGDCNRDGSRLQIRVHSKLTWYVAADTLFEEWAHAMTWPLACAEARTEPHDEAWGIAYAKIRNAFHDRGGYLTSRNYPED